MCYFKLYRRRLISREENNFYKNRCHSAIRQAKRNYFHRYFTNYKNDMRKYWRGIRNLIGKTDGRDGGRIECIKINDCKITDEANFANGFNSHFSTVARRLANELPPADNISPVSQIPFHANSFYFFPVTPDERKSTMKLKNSHYGWDKFSTRQFKIISSPFVNLLMNPLVWVFSLMC